MISVTGAARVVQGGPYFCGGTQRAAGVSIFVWAIGVDQGVGCSVVGQLCMQGQPDICFTFAVGILCIEKRGSVLLRCPSVSPSQDKHACGMESREQYSFAVQAGCDCGDY